ncbi:ankyrin-3 isoform X1 [Bombyx mandarina]|uniref:Ankyrin-3 isoform X1 n=1 Tax=Bombyx mandarina TaxID=7092 RepID=A0A6J2KNS6_BOMMA|nr:ankyrin-3 isoform X1 [Bombyx mandarina]
MENSLEEALFQAILLEDQGSISHLLSKGANPNKTASRGKTCLGEAANTGNVDVMKLLITASKTPQSKNNQAPSRKRTLKCHKRKFKHDGQISETVVKFKNINEKKIKDYSVGKCEKLDLSHTGQIEKNKGYFVFIHNDGSSSDETRVPSLKSPKSSSSMSPSPQADLEWDEDIGNTAPTTSEDETWSSMYKWYAAILESTGAAIASASKVTNGIDQQDAFMRTALHYASEQGHIDTAKLLIEAGCKIDVTASDGLTPLHVAVVKNHIEIVRLLIAAGSNVNYKTHEKMTPLHFASSRGFLDIVKLLVSNGALLEARDTAERTALYLAAGRGHCDVVKYLIHSGANVNGEEIHGYTPLCEAVWQRYTTVVEILLLAGARITHSHRLLHNAIIQRQEPIVKMLTKIGGGINLHNDNGDTPLLLAARLSQPSVARLLLEKGANVNSCNNITGANALHIAVESVESPEHFEVLLKCLLDYNIDMNAITLIGDTALNRALLLQKDHAAVLLIRYGADVNTCDLHSCGLDNLSIASRRETHVLARMLLKAGHYVIPQDPSITTKSTCTTNWVQQTCKQPLTLSDYCRITIRRMCKSNKLFRFVATLPLPRGLKRFLMMEDEGLE